MTDKCCIERKGEVVNGNCVNEVVGGGVTFSLIRTVGLVVFGDKDEGHCT